VLDPDAGTPDLKNCNWLSEGVDLDEHIKLDSNDKVKVNREGVIIKNQ